LKELGYNVQTELEDTHNMNITKFEVHKSTPWLYVVNNILT